MSYDPTLADALSRIRAVLGDTADLPQLRGGEAAYQAHLDAASDDETLATSRAAYALAAQLAHEPDSVSISGQISASWRQRIDALLAIGARYAALAGAASGPFTLVPAVYRSAAATDEYSR